MEKVTYDLHTHSALSPCGDNDMTVNNILHMAVLGGVQVLAVTDHNSCKNCPAAVEVAKGLPIDLIPGMELCTVEEVHVICLFPALDNAMAFDAYVHDRLPAVENRPEIFGEQRILNAADEIVGYEPYLLINATSISIEEVVPLAKRFGGICYPAHVDKSSTSVFSNLGYFSSDWGFGAVEIANRQKIEELAPKIPGFGELLVLHSSDAHYLWDISQGENFLFCNNFRRALGLY
ncbi:MAG: PHP domain-containing protein [Oscillospiraceae bacterium]|nr:PHP domain-containing protein [Oscillospiraceae bacterium]